MKSKKIYIFKKVYSCLSCHHTNIVLVEDKNIKQKQYRKIKQYSKRYDSETTISISRPSVIESISSFNTCYISLVNTCLLVFTNILVY